MTAITKPPGFLLIAICIAPILSNALDVKCHPNYMLWAEDIADLQRTSKQYGPWELARIWTGELMHPGGPYGAGIVYETEVIGNYAIERKLHLANRDWSPWFKKVEDASHSIQYNKWALFSDGVESRVERVFSLGESSVTLGLPDSLSYEKANKYIQDLARNQFQKIKPSLPSTIEIRKMWGIEFDAKNGELRVSLDTGDWSCTTYTFKVDKEHLILVDVTRWQA